MAQELINLGTPNGNDGDVVRDAFSKVNANFTELYSTINLLGGSVDPTDVLEFTLKGDILAQDNTVLIDSETGKLTTAAVPATVPLVYRFTARFLADGNLDTITDIPVGWSFSKSANNVTITHDVGRLASNIAYWGLSSVTNKYRLRHPTAGYEVTSSITEPYSFTLNLNTAVTGADAGQHAIIVVMF